VPRESRYDAFLKARNAEGLRRELRQMGRGGAAEVSIDGVAYVNFAGNDYLGLSCHRDVVSRARDWTQIYGAGAGASRLVTGNLEPFAAIEAKLAALKGMPQALVMASGFQANAAVLQALLDAKVLGDEVLVFADRLNHASMHFGCAAAGVRQIRYRHCDLNNLAELLAKHAGDPRPKFVLTESVFSMDGDIAPMAEIVDLAHQAEAYVVCDDAHATGVLGEKGRGLSDGADLVIGTFSKALGSFGAYVACSTLMRDYLINRCTGLIYSTALPPAVLGAVDAALDLLPTLDAERAHVAQMAATFRQEAGLLGYDVGGSHSQIVPLLVGDSGSALALSAKLADAHVWVSAIRPPTVPKGTARLRIAFSAAHRDADLERLLKALASGGKVRVSA